MGSFRTANVIFTQLATVNEKKKTLNLNDVSVHHLINLLFRFHLAAREDVYGVIVGGVLGHSICTGLAVIGGRMIAQRISVRTGITLSNH